MSELAFTLTKDLVAALAEITGTRPAEAEPVVVLAAYVDALAKEYGLSESLYLDVDPIDRTRQVGPVMDIVRHYFEAHEPELDADSVRSRLYEAVAVLAADPRARKTLNRSQPLTANRVLHLAQIYWNLEATPERAKLPIRPMDGRDIPVPGMLADFARMTWTARVNQKGNYKSAGQSFRTQGARLAVLIAQLLTTNKAPAPGSPTGELDVRTTRDAAEPVEITLRDLVQRAWKTGDYDDAVDLSNSYLTIVKRRAEANPFDVEPDLAGAYLLKGSISLRPTATWGRARFEVGEDTTEDLERAVASYTTLSELHPANDEFRAELLNTYVALSVAYGASGRLAESIQAAQNARSFAERFAAAHPNNREHQKNLLLTLLTVHQPFRDAGRIEEAIGALTRARVVVEQLIACDPVEPAHKETLIALLWGLSQDLRAIQRFDDAVDVATRAVEISDLIASGERAHQKCLASSLQGLSEALTDVGRLEEAVAAAEQSVSVRESLVAAEPQNVEFRVHLAVMTFELARLLRTVGRTRDAVAAVIRTADIFTQLAADDPDESKFWVGLRTSLDELRHGMRDLDRFDDAQAIDEALRRLGDE